MIPSLEDKVIIYERQLPELVNPVSFTIHMLGSLVKSKSEKQ